jgi:hypothetical protein
MGLDLDHLTWLQAKKAGPESTPLAAALLSQAIHETEHHSAGGFFVGLGEFDAVLTNQSDVSHCGRSCRSDSTRHSRRDQRSRLHAPDMPIQSAYRSFR